MKCSCPLPSAHSPIVPTFEVAPLIRSNILRRFQGLNLDPYEDFHTASLLAAKILDDELNFGVSKGIQEFAIAKANDGALLIKGLPVSTATLPLTPTIDGTTNGKDFLSEFLSLGFARLLKAAPYVNASEKDGRVIHQILPIEGRENEASGLGSAISFDWHTENVHEVSPPNYLTLFCLKGQPNAKTTVFPINGLIEQLPNRVMKSLLRETFEFKTGPSYSVTSFFQGSVLSHTHDGGLQIRYNSSESRLVGLDSESKDTLSFVREWMKTNAVATEITLEQGDLLLLDNRKTLHGRTSFQMSPSLEDRRWLQRMYARKI